MAVESFSIPSITSLAPRQASRRSQNVYFALQKDIVLGALKPEATLLELEIAERFQCSQGTVREALMGLNEEGLVKRQPHRGTQVAPCKSADARALIAIRRDIECGYLERVLENAGPELYSDLHHELNNMRNAARDGDEYLMSVHDRAFHARLFAEANLPVVTPILLRCLIHNHRYKILNSQSGRELEETAERHLPILQAVEQRDLNALKQVLGHHISTIVDFGPDLTESA